MKFIRTDDQRDFAASLDKLLAASDTVVAARSWADGDHGPGLKLWERLAEQGVTMLATEATPVELCIAFERLGWWAVPGPYVESAAYLPTALGQEIEGIATVAVAGVAPRALDADVAETVYTVTDGGLHQATVVGDAVASVDRTRRLFEVSAGESVASENLEGAQRVATLAVAAQLLGLGERVLEDSVTYVKQRRQFGREIGSYQAIKHALADVRIALDFARPIVEGAALDAISVSAAKIAASDAAYLASRTGLQVHGAIGYTAEFDLSIWLTKIRALVSAWGTSDHHRAIVLGDLTSERTA